MAADEQKIREVVSTYLDLVASGTAAQIADLYADGATVEDPVGSDVLTTREQIVAFYGGLEGLEQTTRLVDLRVAGGEAVFAFEIRTRAGDATYVLTPFDHMRFDDEGKVVAMRAFWSGSDMTQE